MKRFVVIIGAVALVPAMLINEQPAQAQATPGRHTVGLVDMTTGRWHLWDPVAGELSFFFGNPGDVPFVGDWDCDGLETPGLYRQSDGFVYLRNSNTQGVADVQYFFGDPDDVPVAGDWNGNGCDTVSVYRPSEGRFYVINRLGSGGSAPFADFSYFFGNPGDVPFGGDFDGDTVDTLGLYRETVGMVYFRNSHTTGVADADFFYGNPGDVIIAGDWNGDGRDTVGIARNGSAQFHLRYSNTPGFADETVLIDRDLTDAMPVAGMVGRVGTVPFSELGCGSPSEYTTTFPATLSPSPAPTAPSNAVGVLGMSFTNSFAHLPGCDRAVIGLGASTPPSAFFENAVPANTVPAGMVVSVDANRINVQMPGIERGGITGMQFLANPYAFVVREWEPANRNLYVDIFYPDWRAIRVHFLTDPARIVIDSMRVPSTSIKLGPVLGDGVYLRNPLNPALVGGVTTPVRVVGYARPFEASDVATLTNVATGQPTSATWTGCTPISGGTGCVYGTSDYIEAWGEFRFVIDGLAPGTYRLEVFDTGALENVPARSVSDTFTVAGS